MPSSSDMLVSSPLPTTLEEAFASQPPFSFDSTGSQAGGVGGSGGGGGFDQWSDPSYFNNHFWSQPESSATMDGLAPGVGEQLPGMMLDPNQQEFDVSETNSSRRVFLFLFSSAFARTDSFPPLLFLLSLDPNLQFDAVSPVFSLSSPLSSLSSRLADLPSLPFSPPSVSLLSRSDPRPSWYQRTLDRSF